MKKNILLISAFILAVNVVNAQSGIDRVLENVAANNKTLQANLRLTEVQKLEAHTGNYLANPTVELNQLWGDQNTGGDLNELKVAQSFDFPTVYANKNKLAKLKSATYDYQSVAYRQQILLTAKQTCLEIIFLRKQKGLLDQRLENAIRLAELYGQRLAQGDANQLEINKIQLERINVQNDARLNDVALKNKLEQLQTLNGGLPVEFNETGFPDVALPDFEKLKADYLAADPNLKSLESISESAGREVKLSRAQSLPKFDIGYRRNGGSAETMNGFMVGLSIPLFENKNTVKKARMQADYAVAVIEDNTQNLKSTLQQLYEQALVLRNSRDEYAQALRSQRNVELLNKALDASQISMIDYFIEISILYTTQQSYLSVEKEYLNTVAQLQQYQL